MNSSKWLVQVGWDSVPHLDEAAKAEMLENTPPHLRAARSKGEPSLGEGAIYPIPQEEFVIPAFEIPRHFARGYGLDVGWKRTAAVFGALDRDADVLYINTEHYRGEVEPSVHAAAIQARGDWLIGAADYAGVDPHSGQRSLDVYRALGLNVINADKAVEAGIMAVFERLSTGRLKVFSNCTNLLAEHRNYHRKDGKVVKVNDHAMDALRYMVMKLHEIMQTPPIPKAMGTGFTIADTTAGY